MTSTSSIDLARTRVLVVDDDNVALVYMTATLESWGYLPITARNGPQALDLAESFRPQVVILDINMPVMTGWEVLRRMRRLPATEAAYFIVMTAMDHQDDARITQAAGGHAHLTKPCRNEDLKALLAQEQFVNRRQTELERLYPEIQETVRIEPGKRSVTRDG